ncbi:hypothetical protein ACH4NS_21210 [Streptomyces mutabilis]|jgi:hypothetical protein|uniref:hypothetical protein n=1 Tax=Streptomyces TaxID=1883 RepID=UPI0015CAC7BE|nr:MULTISPECIES: hypothetical protein [unclassified Streptomyces]MDG9694225.1 hypothetical protein [Streptomyces sp. DH17]MDN3245193.1 hypothetical protein [Streptomyces sp. ZSW22]MDN3256383.1 hypothetical protein [Streptomyces sp. MA25(2023)]MDQ0384739.1 hypothetical protein [Streptomyces sp. DSM 42143]
MNERVTPAPAMHALPDGEAEVALVLRLPWEDVARLGQEAGRLAAQMQRPVTLDEAVSHRLRSARGAAHARPAGEQPPAVGAPATASAPASVSSLPSRPPAEQARQAIDRINGTA